MKKGLRKLILSGTALAAVAATLGTSTYAWYTANETVSATNINGASAGATDASIFISKDNSAWSSTVDMTGTWDHDKNAETAEVPFVSVDKLLPVEYTGNSAGAPVFKYLGDTTTTYKTATVTAETFKTDGTLFTRSGSEGSYTYTRVTSGSFDNTATYYQIDTNTYSSGDTASGCFTKFTLYFRTSKIADGNAAPSVYLKNITLTNTTPTTGDNMYTAADNLYYLQSKGYGVDTNQATYSVDFTQALKLVAITDSATAGLASSDTSYVAESVNGKAFDLAKFQNTTLNTFVDGAFDASKADALGYYNNIMGTTLTYDMDEQPVKAIEDYNASKTKINFGTLKRDASAIKVDFYIYLDGWDTFCYDACKGQNYKINLEFTSDPTQALVYTAD